MLATPLFIQAPLIPHGIIFHGRPFTCLIFLERPKTYITFQGHPIT